MTVWAEHTRREISDSHFGYCRIGSRYGSCTCGLDRRQAALDELVALERIAEAADARIQKGHNDTCDAELDRSAGPPFQGYACNCGQDALIEALAAFRALRADSDKEATA